MKIIGFIKFYNEGYNGNLERCLSHISKYLDHIVCCNDSSTDNSEEIARKYTDDIITLPNNFKAELEHKQTLLEYTLSLYPECTYIIHLDPDECLSNPEIVKKLCSKLEKENIDGMRIHLVNLWLSDSWYRLDSQFNTLWKIPIWRNNGKLHFPTTKGLHHHQHPAGLERIAQIGTNTLQIIHYGFSTPELIARKYKTYRSLGQTGWALERLNPIRKAELTPLDTNNIKPYPKPLTQEEWNNLLSKDV